MQDRLVRRITATLFVGQSLSSLGMVAILTVGTIAAVHLTDRPAAAGLPSSMSILGSAIGAYPAGRFMDRYGRRLGLMLGFLLGFAGAGMATLAMVVGLFPLLLLGYGLMGLARGAVDQGRYAAAEIVPVEMRGRAISRVVLGGTIGAIGGPLVIGPAGRLALQLNLHEVAGSFIAGLALFLIGSLLIFFFLRPDPRQLSLALQPDPAASDGAPRSFVEVLRLLPEARLAFTAMVAAQTIMVLLMVITPLHMTDHHHSLTAISWVLAAHVSGMYALSVVTGRVADTWGRETTVRIGALLLLSSCILAPLSSNSVVLAAALFLLGLGWNCCYIAGSSLLSDVLRPVERGRIQGTNDLAVGLSAAVASLGDGPLFAAVGYLGISMVGVVLSLFLLVSSAFLTRMIVRRPEPVEP